MPFLKESRFLALSAANFFSRYHFYLIVFVISSFLAGFIGSAKAEFAIAGANAGAVLVLALMPRIFATWGTKQVLTSLGIAEILILCSLAFAHSAALVIILLVLMISMTFSIFLGLDFLVEAITTDESETGGVRSVFLTTSNISTLIATLTLAVILTDDSYRDVFLAASLVLVPFIMLAWRSFPKTGGTTSSEHTSAWSAIAGIARVPHVLRPIATAHLLLQLYYAWFNFYFTLYLFEHVGFSWHTIAIMLALSMAPYLLLEIPIGWIADKRLGEQEIMVGGFIVLSASIVALALLGDNLLAWTILFLLGTCGAAAIEITTESTFFKRVTAADGEAISLLRILRPVAGIMGPATAGVLLLFVPPPFLFVIFGAIVALGIPLAMSIVDTK